MKGGSGRHGAGGAREPSSGGTAWRGVRHGRGRRAGFSRCPHCVPDDPPRRHGDGADAYGWAEAGRGGQRTGAGASTRGSGRAAAWCPEPAGGQCEPETSARCRVPARKRDLKPKRPADGRGSRRVGAWRVTWPQNTGKPPRAAGQTQPQGPGRAAGARVRPSSLPETGSGDRQGWGDGTCWGRGGGRRKPTSCAPRAGPSWRWWLQDLSQPSPRACRGCSSTAPGMLSLAGDQAGRADP